MLRWLACLFLLILPSGVCAAQQTILLGGQSLVVKPLYQQDFNSVVNRWRYDGRGRVWVQNGRLQMDATGVESTAWFDQEMYGNLLITYEARILPPVDAKNINLIFMATGPDGSDISKMYFSGRYTEYQKIPNYIWTITDTHTRLRRNPGFAMVAESRNQNDLPKANHTYKLAVALWNGTIRSYMDDRLVLTYRDPHPYTQGELAFRSWHTRLWWDNLRVYRILSIAPVSVKKQ